MHKTVLLVLVFVTGCRGLTLQEAQTAVEEITLASQTSALTSNSIEISTNFTIGDAVQQAAEELRAFIESQLPCASVTLQDATLTIEYGALEGSCTYNGHTFSGTHSVTVERNERTAVQVEHTWTDFSNGVMEVDGTATVTWDFESLTRHVVHSSEWTRLSDGRTGQGSGDRLQEALEEGLLTGFRVDGERDWQGQDGHWDLDIDQVEMRWIDPVPQSGAYRLDTPYGKSVTISFDRLSDTQIQVTVKGPRNSFDFKVNRLGS